MAERVVAADLLPKEVGCSSVGLGLHFYRTFVNMAGMEVPGFVSGRTQVISPEALRRC